MSFVNDILITPVSAWVDNKSRETERAEIFRQMEETRAKGLILDLSAVKIMDSCDFRELSKTAGMAAMMGAPAVFMGFRPGVAAFLVESGEDVDHLLTAATTQDAIEVIQGVLFPDKGLEDQEELVEDSEEGAPVNEQMTEAPENVGIR